MSIAKKKFAQSNFISNRDKTYSITMSAEELKETIKQAVQEAIPKPWLTKRELCREFGISDTTLWRIINDPHDPLPYSSLGSKGQLFKRDDVNAFLERRKRNAG